MTTTSIMDRCRFGVDYYPEHWPRDRWETDAAMMRNLGLQVVRMAEFSWHKLEPRAGEFHFDWLDEAIALLGRYGICTILGTPTAAPPAWIIEENPEILPVDSQGQRKGFGGRHHDCQSNAVYRGHIRRLVTAMAVHYRDNPHVVGWQIDNELGNSHEDLCMCPSCQQSFQRWLEKKYGSISRLNDEWGTAFWSQTYDTFEQIPAPRQTPTMHNPSLLLDWKRFCSDLVNDFLRMQAEILRQICPHQKITHNLMGLYDKTDYFTMAAELDFASNDQYPTGYYFDPPGQPPQEISACLDFIRSVKHRNFWMMELESGPTGGALIGAMPRPGQLQLWTAHCVAHGADAIVYFRWRTCLFGSEQFWHGILPHNGVPGRRYRELEQTIRRLTPVLDDIHGVADRAQAAILFSYEQDWAIKIQPQHPELDYIGQVKLYYGAFYDRNIPVEFVNEQEDFGRYPLLVAPLQYLMTPQLEDRLLTYVRDGGTLILTMRTGVKNANNVCMADLPLPGRLAEAAGLIIQDYDCLLGKAAYFEFTADHTGGVARKWCDILSPTTAQTLAEYTSEFYAGSPAITENRYGRGRVVYIGTESDALSLDRIVTRLARELGLASWGDTPNGVELTMRAGREKDYLFALNHTAEAYTLQMPEGWNAMDSAPGDGGHLEPYGVNIYTREHQ